MIYFLLWLVELVGGGSLQVSPTKFGELSFLEVTVTSDVAFSLDDVGDEVRITFTSTLEPSDMTAFVFTSDAAAWEISDFIAQTQPSSSIVFPRSYFATPPSAPAAATLGIRLLNVRIVDCESFSAIVSIRASARSAVNTSVPFLGTITGCNHIPTLTLSPTAYPTAPKLTLPAPITAAEDTTISFASAVPEIGIKDLDGDKVMVVVQALLETSPTFQAAAAWHALSVAAVSHIESASTDLPGSGRGGVCRDAASDAARVQAYADVVAVGGGGRSDVPSQASIAYDAAAAAAAEKGTAPAPRQRVVEDVCSASAVMTLKVQIGVSVDREDGTCLLESLVRGGELYTTSAADGDGVVGSVSVPARVFNAEAAGSGDAPSGGDGSTIPTPTPAPSSRLSPSAIIAAAAESTDYVLRGGSYLFREPVRAATATSLLRALKFVPPRHWFGDVHIVLSVFDVCNGRAAFCPSRPQAARHSVVSLRYTPVNDPPTIFAHAATEPSHVASGRLSSGVSGGTGNAPPSAPPLAPARCASGGGDTGASPGTGAGSGGTITSPCSGTAGIVSAAGSGIYLAAVGSAEDGCREVGELAGDGQRGLGGYDGAGDPTVAVAGAGAAPGRVSLQADAPAALVKSRCATAARGAAGLLSTVCDVPRAAAVSTVGYLVPCVEGYCSPAAAGVVPGTSAVSGAPPDCGYALPVVVGDADDTVVAITARVHAIVSSSRVRSGAISWAAVTTTQTVTADSAESGLVDVEAMDGSVVTESALRYLSSNTVNTILAGAAAVVARPGAAATATPNPNLVSRRLTSAFWGAKNPTWWESDATLITAAGGSTTNAAVAQRELIAPLVECGKQSGRATTAPSSTPIESWSMPTRVAVLEPLWVRVGDVGRACRVDVSSLTTCEVVYLMVRVAVADAASVSVRRVVVTVPPTMSPAACAARSSFFRPHPLLRSVPTAAMLLGTSYAAHGDRSFTSTHPYPPLSEARVLRSEAAVRPEDAAWVSASALSICASVGRCTCVDSSLTRVSVAAALFQAESAAFALPLPSSIVTQMACASAFASSSRFGAMRTLAEWAGDLAAHLSSCAACADAVAAAQTSVHTAAKAAAEGNGPTAAAAAPVADVIVGADSAPYARPRLVSFSGGLLWLQSEAALSATSSPSAAATPVATAIDTTTPPTLPVGLMRHIAASSAAAAGCDGDVSSALCATSTRPAATVGVVSDGRPLTLSPPRPHSVWLSRDPRCTYAAQPSGPSASPRSSLVGGPWAPVVTSRAALPFSAQRAVVAGTAGAAFDATDAAVAAGVYGATAGAVVATPRGSSLSAASRSVELATASAEYRSRGSRGVGDVGAAAAVHPPGGAAVVSSGVYRMCARVDDEAVVLPHRMEVHSVVSDMDDAIALARGQAVHAGSRIGSGVTCSDLLRATLPFVHVARVQDAAASSPPPSPSPGSPPAASPSPAPSPAPSPSPAPPSGPTSSNVKGFRPCGCYYRSVQADASTLGVDVSIDAPIGGYPNSASFAAVRR